jgi:hypothetical protein
MSRPVAVVTGLIAAYNVGGVVWDYGQYALGLEQLGFDVYYLEDSGGLSFDPRLGLYQDDYAYGANFLERELAALSPSLAARWHLRAPNDVTYGMDATSFVDVVTAADIFLNVSGAALLRDEYLASRRKVLIDTDPGWNHFRNYPRWDDAPNTWYGTAGWRSHDEYFTYAELIGRPECKLPLLGLNWQTTRPVVVPDRWQAEAPGDTWTTVMTWKNFDETIEHEGLVYGTKELEFPKIEQVPGRVDARFEVAVGGASPPVDEWRRVGWSVVDSVAVSRTASNYRSYIQRSRGEFSVAKNVYVATNSGWFSCRSVCFLAAGRPVVIQDTGFSQVIPTGMGILPFRSSAEAVRALERAEADYATHSGAARELAAREFGAERVLGELLDHVGVH